MTSHFVQIISLSSLEHIRLIYASLCLEWSTGIIPGFIKNVLINETFWRTMRILVALKANSWWSNVSSGTDKNIFIKTSSVILNFQSGPIVIMGSYGLRQLKYPKQKTLPRLKLFLIVPDFFCSSQFKRYCLTSFPVLLLGRLKIKSLRWAYHSVKGSEVYSSEVGF